MMRLSSTDASSIDGHAGGTGRSLTLAERSSRLAATGRRGFSLVEALIAMAILAFFMAGVATSQGQAIDHIVEMMDLSSATQIIEAVVLDVEEEYRLIGFPSNPIDDEDCSDSLPDAMKRNFDCEYDLLMLEMGADNLGSMGAEANENITQSPLMGAFCTGGADGMSPVDPAMALANLTNGGQALPQGMNAFGALLDPGFQQICGINISKMCSNTQMITSFIPTIIEQAALTTRKLVVRLRWGDDDEGNFQALEIETFITATPEAEETGP